MCLDERNLIQTWIGSCSILKLSFIVCYVGKLYTACAIQTLEIISYLYKCPLSISVDWMEKNF